MEPARSRGRLRRPLRPGPLGGAGFFVVGILTMVGCSLQSLLAEVDRDADAFDAGSSFIRRDLCGNGVDEDEDGRIDEGCPCGPREMQRCFPGLLSQRGVGRCADGVQRCVLSSNGEWGDWRDAPCEGAVLAETEICDGRDHDCDGAFDEGCPCTSSETRVCGPTSLSAPCMAGTQTCSSNGAWSECIGAIGPAPEICDGVDNDCDGVVDLGCACVPEPEVCDDGIDNDCDGRVDEPACRPDWPLCAGMTPGWTSISTMDAPSYFDVRGVWTGTEMLLWGSTGLDGSGFRFEPQSNMWRRLPDGPSLRLYPAAVWTGREVLIWGGAAAIRDASRGDGAAFDPESYQWRPITLVDSPTPRESFVYVWTGAEMIVWGGRFTDGIDDPPVLLNDGGIYDPSADSWRPMSQRGAPSARAGAHAVWTGAEMIVWGSSSPADRGTGAIYDPTTDRWRPLETADGPGPRENAMVVWTGREMAVWGGDLPGSRYLDTGALFDPLTNRWRPISTAGAPEGRSSGDFVRPGQVAVSTGHGFLVWGGLFDPSRHSPNILTRGAVYDSETETWTPITDTGAPEGRIWHLASWTGCSLIVWGGGVASDGGGVQQPAMSGGIWIPE